MLWLYARKGEGLSPRVRRLIEDEPEIAISPMVLLELDYLYEIGRTTLDGLVKSRKADFLPQHIGIM